SSLSLLYRCRCLWRGLEQMTRKTPRLRMILQFSQIRFTETRTFMVSVRLSPPGNRSPPHRRTDPRAPAGRSLPVDDPALRQVVRRDLQGHPIAGQDADE